MRPNKKGNSAAKNTGVQFPKEMLEMSIKEIISLMGEEYSGYFIQDNDRKILFIETALQSRVEHLEKLNYLQSVIAQVINDLERVSLSPFTQALSSKFGDLINSGNRLIQAKAPLTNVMSGKDAEMMKAMSKILESLFTTESSELGEELKEAMKMLDDLINDGTDELPAIVNSKNPQEAYITIMISVLYKQKFLEFLNEKYLSLKAEGNTTVFSSEPIEWLGTQKQLAELFIELEKKGWINKPGTKQIQAAFTKSNTIDQILKPSQNKVTKLFDYEGVYTTNYNPVFASIKPNKP
jgi:hypothetical protein